MKRYAFVVFCMFMVMSLIVGYVAEIEAAQGQIALYTSVPEPIANKIQNDFQTRYPEITLDIFRAGTSEVVAKIMTEKEAGEIMADLVWVAEPSTYEDFKDQDGIVRQFLAKKPLSCLINDS